MVRGLVSHEDIADFLGPAFGEVINVLDGPEVAEPRTEVFVPCVTAHPVPTGRAGRS